MSDTPDPVRPVLESVTEDVRLLVAQTARMARAEATAALRSTAFYLAAAAVGVFIAVAGALVLVSALVLIAIALGLPPWVAAVSVAVLLIGIGAGTAYFSFAGLGRVEFDLHHTRRSITETIAWLKAQTQ